MDLPELSEVNIRLYNIMGQVVFKAMQSDRIGFLQQSIKMAELLSGIYILKAELGSEIFVKKIVKII